MFAREGSLFVSQCPLPCAALLQLNASILIYYRGFYTPQRGGRVLPAGALAPYITYQHVWTFHQHVCTFLPCYLSYLPITNKPFESVSGWASTVRDPRGAREKRLDQDQ
jgi:hypothetical protein